MKPYKLLKIFLVCISLLIVLVVIFFNSYYLRQHFFGLTMFSICRVKFKQEVDCKCLSKTMMESYHVDSFVLADLDDSKNMAILLACEGAKVKVETQYYSDGKIKSESYLNTYKEYYPSGQLKIIGKHKNGEWNSFVYYHSNGNRYKEEYYKERKETGTFRYYDVEGILTRTINYDENGELTYTESLNRNGEVIWSSNKALNIKFPSTEEEWKISYARVAVDSNRKDSFTEDSLVTHLTLADIDSIKRISK